MSDRWLRFADKADRLPDGEYVAVDVMKLSFDDTRELGDSRKLASLVVSRHDLERAISTVQWTDSDNLSANEVPMEKQVDTIVKTAMDQLAILSEDAYFRDAIMKAVIREVCHRFIDLEVSGDDIADHLEVMAGVMREGASA